MNLEFRPAMHDVSMSGGEKPVSKASENRRATKPIMEKRRRARINQCLSELKTLILDALNKDPSRHSKLEKADILEMTVRHLQNIQRQQMAAAISSDSSVLNKFKAGFGECASEVTRYVSRVEGLAPALRQRLLAHLSNCLTAMSSASSSAGLLQSLSVQIPALRQGSDLNNNSGGSSSGQLFAGLSVIPSRLPNGDFAFLLPSQALAGAGQMFHLPTVSLPSSSSSSGGGGVQEQRTTSQSSWAGPASPSSKRSASPDPMSDDNAVLSPTCSDAGSDVFIEPYHHHHHLHQQQPRVLSPYPAHAYKERNNPAPPSNHLHETENVWRPW